MRTRIENARFSRICRQIGGKTGDFSLFFNAPIPRMARYKREGVYIYASLKPGPPDDPVRQCSTTNDLVDKHAT